MAAVALAWASPVDAQSRGTSQSLGRSGTTAGPQPMQTVNVPTYPTTYVVTDRPKDTRSQRQRCIDDETAKEGGSPSALTLASIDLKCSQR